MNNKIGVLFVGLNGMTANTTVVGKEIVAKKLAPKYGMMTETDLFKKHPLIDPKQICFGGWDLNNRNAYELGLKYKIIEPGLVKKVRKETARVKPMPGIISGHDVDFLKKSDYIKKARGLKEQLELIKQDIIRFRKDNKCRTTIVIFTGSPLKNSEIGRIHQDIKSFKKAVEQNHPEITSGMIYALAAIETGSPFIDFTPNLTLRVPALTAYAKAKNVPLAGKDGNTGQTLMKTTIGQMMKIRNLKISGWYSTNIIGNMDGKVLGIPEHCIEKMNDKKGVLSPILGYDDFDHIVDIRYYLPRGDNKESWDNIDFLGWLGMPMSFKINWLGRDSILAGPLILDLIRLVEYAERKGKGGIQSQLAMFFKNPLGTPARGFFDEYNLLLKAYK